VSERHLDCEEVLRHLLEYLDRALDEDDMAAIDRHLERCRACFGRAEFEKRLKDAIGAAAVRRASPGLRARLKHIIGRF
jgi:anti-sigma factor (TIGR02949 family)